MSSDWIFKSQAMMAPIEQRYEMQANQNIVQAGKSIGDAAHRMSETHLKNKMFAIQTQRLDMIQNLKMKDVSIKMMQMDQAERHFNLSNVMKEGMLEQRQRASVYDMGWIPSSRKGYQKHAVPGPDGKISWEEKTNAEVAEISKSKYAGAGSRGGARDVRQRIAARDDVGEAYGNEIGRIATGFGAPPAAIAIATQEGRPNPNFLYKEQYEQAKQQLGMFRPFKKVNAQGEEVQDDEDAAGYILFEPETFNRIFAAVKEGRRSRDRDLDDIE